MHKKKKKTSKTHYTANVVTVNAWCYQCAWDFFPCSEHEYVLLLFITMALWVSGLIRATLVLFNLLVVQPEPTMKILCLMIKLYTNSPEVIKHFHSVHDFSLAVQWETVLIEISVYTVYIYHNAAGTSKCQHCLCN